MKEKINKGLKNKVSVIQAILTVLYVVSLLISNIITSKQVLFTIIEFGFGTSNVIPSGATISVQIILLSLSYTSNWYFIFIFPFCL